MSPFDRLMELMKQRLKINFVPGVGSQMDLANGYQVTLARTRFQRKLVITGPKDRTNPVEIYQTAPDDDPRVNHLIDTLITDNS